MREHDIFGVRSQYLQLKDQIDSAVHDVLDSGMFLLGPKTVRFEKEFAEYIGCRHGIAVASGTDAIHLALRALGIGDGDEIITPVHTAAPTVIAIQLAGAVPVLVDIDESYYTLDPQKVEQAVTSRTKAVLPVHLYGQPADMDPIMAIAKRHGLYVVEDCAQSHGARYKEKMTGTFGIVSCFSFYPTKNLGAFGDAGMIVTDDEDIARKCRSLREYGQAARYDFQGFGINSRMDDIQASILLEKLAHLDDWNARRQSVARGYDALIGSAISDAHSSGGRLEVILPRVAAYAGHVYHLYVIRSSKRDALREALERKGIKTAIHYPKPIHLYPHFRNLGYHEGDFPVAERVTQEILSLPIHPFLHEEVIREVAKSVEEVCSA